MQIVSDLEVKSSSITDGDFDQLLANGSASGHSNFRPFIVGDYNYEKSLVKVVLKTSGGVQSRISDLQLVVDVPDIVNRGESTTSSTSTVRVLFDRPYNTKPEVIPTLKSGTVFGFPKVTNIDTFGFDLELLDTTQARIVGVVGWISRGY